MSPPAADPGGPDDRLWRLLADFTPLPPADLAAARGWWQAAGAAEPPAEFLARHGVLLPRAVKELGLILKGYVAPTDLTRLVAADAADRIRRATAAPPPGPAAGPADGPDTDTVSRVFPVLFAGAAHRATDCDDETGENHTPLSRPTPPVAPAAADRGPADAADVGRVLGKCLLTERVGEGGSGVVFRGVHQGLNIPVAVKVLRLDRQAVVRSQVRHEAQLLARLNHPHVVRVWDFDDAGAAPYLVLEWVDGPTLGDLIRQSGRLAADRAVQVVSQVAAGLAEAHRLGIVHRDVKPANVLLTRDGVAKLADLGTAVAGRAAAGAGVAGTVAYMAPELFRGAPPGPASDIYSLGVTLYQAVTGVLPFGAGTALEVMVRHASEPPPPPHDRADGIPPAVSAAVLRAMAKDPADRFGSCHEFVAALTAPGPSPAAPFEPGAATVRAAGPGSGAIRAIWRSVFGGRE